MKIHQRIWPQMIGTLAMTFLLAITGFHWFEVREKDPEYRPAVVKSLRAR